MTITRVRTAEEWAVVWQVSELLADVFQLETRSFASSSTAGSTAQTTNNNGSGRRTLSHWVYRISAMLYALLLHSQPDCRQLMIVARALHQHDADIHSSKPSPSKSPWQVPAAIMGAVSLTNRQAESNFAGPQFDIGTQYALVNNMAVASAARRRGIARLLMGACEAAAVQLMDPRPRFMALLCYKDNEAAHRLYQSTGFTECTAWQDTQWIQDAERGKLGKPQRLLMVKHLPPPIQTRSFDSNVLN